MGRSIKILLLSCPVFLVGFGNRTGEIPTFPVLVSGLVKNALPCCKFCISIELGS
jgi:hypothetical protein